MARVRLLAPGFFENEDLGECSPLARLLFAGIWCWADREGRIEDRPRRLKAQILPYDEADGEKLVQELVDRGFLVRYEADGVRVLQVATFSSHQRPHEREAPSVLPPPPQGSPKANPGRALGEPKANPGPAEGEPAASQGEPQGRQGCLDPGSRIQVKQLPARAREAAPPPPLPGLPSPGAPPADDPLARFRRQLANELAVLGLNPLRIAKPQLVPLLREHVDRLGLEVAVRLCAQHARDCGKVPKTLDWFADFLAEQEGPPPVREPDERPKPGDPDFNDPDAWPSYGEYLRRDTGKPPPRVIMNPDGTVTLRPGDAAA